MGPENVNTRTEAKSHANFRATSSAISKQPDLAPSDFYLFKKLNEDLRGKHFATDDDVITAVTG